MKVYYVLIAYGLTGDSEILFYPTKDAAETKFNNVVNPLLKVCDKNELTDDDFYQPNGGNSWRFNSGECEELDLLIGETNMYITWGNSDIKTFGENIETEPSHCLVTFSEWNCALYCTSSDIIFIIHKFIITIIHVQIMVFIILYIVIELFIYGWNHWRYC